MASATPKAKTLTTVAQQIDVPIGNRDSLTIWNRDGAIIVLVGTDANSCVIPVLPLDYLTLDWPSDIPVFAKCESATVQIAIAEVTLWPHGRPSSQRS